MRHSFYKSEEYREKQRQITKANAEKGIYDHLKKRMGRSCVREGCLNVFETTPADAKRFCSKSCAAIFTNTGRTRSPATRKKISTALTGREGWSRGRILVPLREKICPNEWCRQTFIYKNYKKRKFCSAICAGKRPTSPKASRGKSGVRPDINSTINFHSRWEANVARMYTHLGIDWVYEPKTFDIGGHTYTPDFYLPKYDEYLEVKNFWNEYAANRDQMFRSKHPNIYLRVLLRDEYLALQKLYGKAIKEWEFSK